MRMVHKFKESPLEQIIKTRLVYLKKIRMPSLNPELYTILKIVNPLVLIRCLATAMVNNIAIVLNPMG